MPQISNLNPRKTFTLRVFESRIQYFECQSRNWIQMIEARPERSSGLGSRAATPTRKALETRAIAER